MKQLKLMAMMSLFVMCLLLVSCQRQSLQQYMVEKSESPNFTNLTINPNDFVGAIPASEEKTAFLKRIDKINILSYDCPDEATFEKELLQAKQIIKNQNLTELLRFNEKNVSTQVLYLGTDENIREVILFFIEKGEKFAITRVITHGVHIDQVAELVSALQLDKLK